MCLPLAARPACIIAAAFRSQLLGCVTKLGAEVEAAFGGQPQVGGC